MSKTPVIIGVGDIINRSTLPADALEPRTLIHRAILAAAADSGASAASLLNDPDLDVDIVRSWT